MFAPRRPFGTGCRRQGRLRSGGAGAVTDRSDAVAYVGDAPAVLTTLAFVLRGGGVNFTKVADVQNRKLAIVSCQQCGYTELYKGETSMLGNILDFLEGG